MRASAAIRRPRPSEMALRIVGLLQKLYIGVERDREGVKHATVSDSSIPSLIQSCGYSAAIPAAPDRPATVPAEPVREQADQHHRDHARAATRRGGGR